MKSGARPSRLLGGVLVILALPCASWAQAIGDNPAQCLVDAEEYVRQESSKPSPNFNAMRDYVRSHTRPFCLRPNVSQAFLNGITADEAKAIAATGDFDRARAFLADTLPGADGEYARAEIQKMEKEKRHQESARNLEAARALASHGQLSEAQSLLNADDHLDPGERQAALLDLSVRASNYDSAARREQAREQASNPKLASVAWSLASCAWTFLRTQVVDSAKRDQKYAKELGGNVSQDVMQVHQQRLRTADDHVASANREAARARLAAGAKDPVPKCTKDVGGTIAYCLHELARGVRQGRCAELIAGGLPELVLYLDSDLSSALLSW